MTYHEKFSCNSLTSSQQDELRAFPIAIVGLGGTGGFALENLVRLGAENIIVFDHDRFELSNFNRQILATEDSLDIKKTSAAADRARSINKRTRIRAYSRFTGPKNAKIVVDGADNVETKLRIARTAREKKIPLVFSSANSFRGIVTVFTNYRFEKAFQINENLEYKKCSSILAPVAAIAGSFAASQALNYIVGRPYVKAPEALFFDLFKNKFWRAELG
ncbi:ThiF family adenylyltransferase [Candidatus Micrarchaeota archaeon]|nr:ThiF family adenylyltransferase [Candidatus Micrarchaeota archaeon]